MPGKFSVEAYNLSAKPVRAAMTGWMIAPGTWRMSGKGLTPRTFTFERTAAVPLAFAPHRTTMIDFELVKSAPSTSDRPDLGIGADDVAVSGSAVSLTVHSLGAKDTAEGVAYLEDANGRVLSQAKVPPLAAPTDLVPHTATVTLPLKPGAARVAITLGGGVPALAEITQMNNEVALPGAPPKAANPARRRHKR